MKTSYKVASWATLVGGLALAAQADTIIGSWLDSTAGGWIDWGNGLSITDPANASKYSFVSGAASGYLQSLQISQAGWNQGLALKLEYTPGYRAAFLDNHLLNFTFSVPPAGTNTSGYSQIYALTINASGYGWHDQSWGNATATGSTGNNQSGMPNYYFWNGAGSRSQTVTLDYSSILPSITATPDNGYIELIFTSNTGSGAPNNFFMNNVVLSGGVVPEPTSLALLILGASLWGLRKGQGR